MTTKMRRFVWEYKNPVVLVKVDAKKMLTPPAAKPRPSGYFRAEFGDTATMAPAPPPFAPPPSLTFGASMRAVTATMAPAPPPFAPPPTLTFGANMRAADAVNSSHGGQGPAPRDGPENPRQQHDYEKQHAMARVPGQSPSHSNDACDELDALLEKNCLAEFYARPSDGRAVMTNSYRRVGSRSQHVT